MDHVCSAGGDEGRATCKVLMKSPIEMTARDGKRTRLNGASDIVGGSNAWGGGCSWHESVTWLSLGYPMCTSP
jgi:hypothetical protein